MDGFVLPPGLIHPPGETPAYDLLQHMINFPERLAADPAGSAARMAGLTGLDAGRVRLWLFARCVQESIGRGPLLRAAAERLAP